MTPTGPRKILLGRISAPHGIRGEVLIKAFTQDPEAIAAYGALSSADGRRTFEIRVVRVTPKGVVARIAGIADRNGAEAVAGTDLYAPREALPEPAEDDFYVEDLVGLAAHSPDGTAIGTIVAVPNFGAGDLLEIRMAGSRRTELVPFTRACVPQIDLAAGQVTIMMPAVAPEEPGERKADDGEA